MQTKSVEFMPFSLSFFLFLNGGVWSGYALLVKDYYIGVRLSPFFSNLVAVSPVSSELACYSQKNLFHITLRF